MSQSEFAEFLGISQSFLSMLLSGRRKPGIDILYQISEKLNVPIEKLYKKETA
jgi:transcriptional regulator with XRE-family HTH domain